MTVRYHQRRAALYPTYVCQREGIDRGTPICQDVPGAGIDDAVGATLVAMVSPAALEVALAVQQELAGRIEEADRLRHNQVERARYEADVARRRFIKVDPDNRLVADALEAEWNGRLRELAAAQAEYERKRIADRKIIDDEQRKQVLALATDFPRLWRDPKTSMRERKRMARLLIEDVTLARSDAIAVNLRFKGGATKTLSLPLPRCSWELRQTSAEVIAQIDRLLDSHTDGVVAQILNQSGHRSGEGLPFHNRIILRLRRDHGLKSRSERLRDKGMLSLSEAAAKLRVAPSTVKLWRCAGLITSELANDKGEHFYLIPLEGAPTKKQGSKLSRRLLAKPVPVESSEGGAV